MGSAAILKLQRAGFTDPQVEALAEYLDSQAATKADIARLELKIEETRSDLELKIEESRSALELKIEETRSKIEQTKSELIKWVVGIGFAQVATILAILRPFPNAHP